MPSGPPETDFLAALDREASRRLEAFLRGVELYRTAPPVPSPPEPPVLWRRGTARLLDYGPGEGRPLLVVPSLINRATVLDLTDATSLLRHLSAHGVRPLLLDWRTPGPEELSLDLAGVLRARLLPALSEAEARAGGPVDLLGYCMGGTLSVALAAARPEAVRRLALLAAPWDFRPGGAPVPLGRWAEWAAPPGADPRSSIPVPVDALQTLFALVEPLATVRKFLRLGERAAPPEPLFVALEDWSNDGVPLAASVARDCARDWYAENRPARGSWAPLGQPVRPAALAHPTLVVAPGRDRIVPAASALALAADLPRAETLTPDLGHVGLVVSQGARAQVWGKLVEFLAR